MWASVHLSMAPNWKKSQLKQQCWHIAEYLSEIFDDILSRTWIKLHFVPHISKRLNPMKQVKKETKFFMTSISLPFNLFLLRRIRDICTHNFCIRFKTFDTTSTNQKRNTIPIENVFQFGNSGWHYCRIWMHYFSFNFNVPS